MTDLHQLDIPMDAPSDVYLACWDAAYRHLISLQSQSSYSGRFVNCSPYPPTLEHFCFVLGNQIFFVCIKDVDGNLDTPTGPSHCKYAAGFADGTPCILKMRNVAGQWVPASGGWSLTEIDTDSPINPPNRVTPQRVVISDWELMDFAVEFACEQLETQGLFVISRNSDLNMYPSIFFESEDGVTGFVQVYASRGLDDTKVDPERLQDTKRQLWEQGYAESYYIIVRVLSEEKVLDSAEVGESPIFRGDGCYMGSDEGFTIIN